jgi:hypothetical protein
MSATDDLQVTHKESGLVRRSRVVVVVLAQLFAVGIVVQVFLVGLSVFESASFWGDHAALGSWLGLIPIPLVLASLVGHLPVRLVVLASMLIVLSGLQHLLVRADEGHLAALHPVSALALFGLAVQLGTQTRRLLDRPT